MPFNGENLKKAHRKMFSQTNHMKQDYIKNHLTLAKTNCVSNCTLFCAKIMLFITNKLKARVKNIPSLFLSCLPKMNQ